MRHEGLLLVDKASGSTSFQIVAMLRRLTRVEAIGHTGTLDPFATGVMAMLIGKSYTKKAEKFLAMDKGYRAMLFLGVATDTFDCEGCIVERSDKVPSLREVECVLASFQGEILQVPPMFSAKKVGGKKLYDLARKGITVERLPVKVRLQIRLVQYAYPHLEISVDCSKGTYIRSLAHDIGQALGSCAHLAALTRTRLGDFLLEECIPQALLKDRDFDVEPYLRSV